MNLTAGTILLIVFAGKALADRCAVAGFCGMVGDPAGVFSRASNRVFARSPMSTGSVATDRYEHPQPGHVRFGPKATAGDQTVIGRFVP